MSVGRASAERARRRLALAWCRLPACRDHCRSGFAPGSHSVNVGSATGCYGSPTGVADAPPSPSIQAQTLSLAVRSGEPMGM